MDGEDEVRARRGNVHLGGGGLSLRTALLKDTKELVGRFRGTHFGAFNLHYAVGVGLRTDLGIGMGAKEIQELVLDGTTMQAMMSQVILLLMNCGYR